MCTRNPPKRFYTAATLSPNAAHAPAGASALMSPRQTASEQIDTGRAQPVYRGDLNGFSDDKTLLRKAPRVFPEALNGVTRGGQQHPPKPNDKSLAKSHLPNHLSIPSLFTTTPRAELGNVHSLLSRPSRGAVPNGPSPIATSNHYVAPALQDEFTEAMTNVENPSSTHLRRPSWQLTPSAAATSARAPVSPSPQDLPLQRGQQDLLDSTRDPKAALSIWKGASSCDVSQYPTAKTCRRSDVRCSGTLSTGIAPNADGAIGLDVEALAPTATTSFRVKSALDHCIKQDEAVLHLDKWIAHIPIGNYIPVSKVFSMTEPSFEFSFAGSPKSAGQTSYNASNLPEWLRQVIRSYSQADRVGFPRKALFGSIPDLDVFWYTGKNEQFSSPGVLHLWRWTSVGHSPLELNFPEPVTAVGHVAPKYFFSQKEDWNAADTAGGSTLTSSPARLLLVATTSSLSLWALYDCGDNAAGGPLNAVATRYRCSSPKAPVTAIAGHDDSGRLFFGDAKGGIYEFVFLPSDPSSESWASFLYRLVPWSFRYSKPKVITLSEKIAAPSLFRRVLGSVLGEAHGIAQLVMDGSRGLLYALDEASNIQLFYLPPPDVSIDKGVTEYPLQPIAVLNHGTIVSQMRHIYRQVLRVTHHDSTKEGAVLRNSSDVIVRDHATEAMIDKHRLARLVPVGLKEGDTVIAVALAEDGSRLYLRARLELPLLPKRLEMTHTPDISNFQFIKSLDVVNWKPPPTSLLRSVSKPCLDEAPMLSQCFYSNYTLLSVFPSSGTSCALSCVALDESSVYQFSGSGNDTTSRGRTLRDWCQLFSLPDSEVLAIYEQPLPTPYARMLNGDGPLPGPYDIVGRMYTEKLMDIKKRESAGLVTKEASSSHPTDPLDESHRRVNVASSRTSISPWGSHVVLPDSALSLDSASGAGTTVCHRYVSPSSLHFWTATQTVPARMFVFLTTRGVYQLQQNRFYDLLKDTASSYIEACSQPRQELLVADLARFCCAELSPNALNTTNSFLLASPGSLAQLGLQVPDLDPALRRLAPYLLFNVDAVSRLITQEQAMAVAWQVLTFIAGWARWKKSDISASMLCGKTDTLSQRIASKQMSNGPDTPFGTALRRKRQDAASPSPRSTWLPAADQGLLPAETLPQFPLPLLQQILFSWLTHPAVHQRHAFQNCCFSSADGCNGISIVRSFPSASTYVQPWSHTADGAGTVVPARAKGLMLYFARVLRPFWSCPIFDTLIVNNPFESGNSCSLPAVYRIPQDVDPFSSSDRDVFFNAYSKLSSVYAPIPRVSSEQKGERRHVQLEEANPPSQTAGVAVSFSRKRSRTPETPSVSFSEPSPPSSKRIRPQEGKPAAQPEERAEKTDQKFALVLTSRFTPEEFDKTCDWLDQLQCVVSQVVKALEHQSKKLAASVTDGGSLLPQHLSRATHSFSAVSQSSSSGFLRYPATQTSSRLNAVMPKPKASDWEYHRLENELQLLRSLGASISLASQYLGFCSLLLTETKEACFLRAALFDALSVASLSDMVIGVPEIHDAIQSIMLQHCIPPQRLLQRCVLLFSREDLQFQCSLHPLMSSHQSIMSHVDWHQNGAYSDDALLDRASLLRSPNVTKAIDALLTAASRPHRPVSLDIGLLASRLAELQLFDVLGDFISRVAEGCILEANIQQDSVMNDDTTPSGRRCELPTSSAPETESRTEDYACYRNNPQFQLCHAVSFKYLELLLERYFVLNRSSRQESIAHGTKTLAASLVNACLALPTDPLDAATRHTPRSVARAWLHFVILDWINDAGQRQFPVSLENAHTPVYASWVTQRKADLGPDSAEVLARFFLNHGHFSEYAEFLLHIASREWPDPTELLAAESTFLPNYNGEGQEELYHYSSSAASSSSCFCALSDHASPVDPGALQTMQHFWSQFVEYLHTVCLGCTLEERYAYLVEARDGLATGEERLNSQQQGGARCLGLNSKASMTSQCAALRSATRKVTQAMNMVQLQAALCRETLEIAYFLCLKYDGSKEGLFHQAFSSDENVRKQATAQLLDTAPNKYHYVHNVYSLLYLLRWKIYETPVTLLQLVQQFAEASKLLIPYPGFALLLHPELVNPKLLPYADQDLMPLQAGVSRQSIVAAAVFCRGFIAVELQAPGLLSDFVSKVLYCIMETRTHSVPSEADEKSSFLDVSSSQGSRFPSKTLLYCFSDIILTLHEVALAFRNAKIPEASSSSSLVAGETSVLLPNCSWSTRWWLWPFLLIEQQLNRVDNRVSWDKERQLEGHQKLPIYQHLVEEYQHILDAFFKDKLQSSAGGAINAGMFQQEHIGLRVYHCFVIMLDLQEAWVKQLMSMGSSLAYIHLLTADAMVSEIALPAAHSNAVPSASPFLTTARATPSTTPLKSRSPLTYSFADATDGFSQALTPRTRRTLELEHDYAPNASKSKNGQARLTTHLLQMYYKSPSKLQFLSERCHDLIKGCEQVWRQQKEWFTHYQHGIQCCLDLTEQVTTARDDQNQDDITDALALSIQELRLAKCAFLSSLDKLQQHVPLLQTYHRVLQRVLTQKTAP